MKNYSAIIFNVFGLLATIIGVVLTAYSIQALDRLHTLDWDSMQNAAKHVAKVSRREFVPDYIITPGQKGGIFAYLISEYYDREIPILTGYLISKDEAIPDTFDNNLLIQTRKWYVVLPKEILNRSGQRVLIADDCVMGGTFINELKTILCNNGYKPEQIRTCSIVTSQFSIDQDIEPDYYWKIIDSDFFFPWGKAK